MKILYAIQGTGNGHVSRAREIIPYLKTYGEVDVVLSGTDSEVDIGHPIKFRLHGLGFKFGKKGGVDILKTIRHAKIFQFIRDIKNLPVHDYDMVIHDIEPVTSWACWFKNKPFLELSHQASFYSPNTPVAPGIHYGKYLMKFYVPKKHYVGFHFKAYDHFITTPVIRSEIRKQKPVEGDFYLVYLPAYSNAFLADILGRFDEKWIVFSKTIDNSVTAENIEFHAVSAEGFSEKLLHCKGLLTGAGFESPAEAIFLGKKLMCIPMHNQYEQKCNAQALEEMGIPIAHKNSEIIPKIEKWLESEHVLQINFPDNLEQTIAQIMTTYGHIQED
ncbi:MAG: glycosyltransferase family protein [Weeksellaceae bacterium]|nr:glycosyltransferase family protein [Weeksellaceae bacterium]